jgi:hypothetical protein
MQNKNNEKEWEPFPNCESRRWEERGFEVF